MAYAAYRESFGANTLRAPPAERPQSRKLMVLDLTVPSSDAFQVRHLLSNCPDTGVVRCMPRPHDGMVLLKIQLPADRMQEVLHLLVTSLPSGVVGAFRSWRSYLKEHGLTHGF